MTHLKKVSVIIVCLSLSAGAAAYRAQSAANLVATSQAFLASLSAEQADRARFDFGDEERFNWHFIPRERLGLPLKDMEPHQKSLAHAMMSAVFSARGMIKAATIMSLEPILAQLEGPDRRFPRDPELYYFSIFGSPSETGTWGWRLEGHHVAVNVTVVNGRIAAASPAMLGTNPAEVREGPRAGLRVLAEEEDLAFRLVESLDSGQLDRARIEVQPRDIVTGSDRKAMIEEPVGLRVSEMGEGQKAIVRQILEVYAGRMAPATATATLRDIENVGGEDAVRFAWAGSTAQGQAHYYRLHGPTFVAELDNSQNNANHIHSVFRNFEGDFGVDVLAAHYEAFPHAAFAD